MTTAASNQNGGVRSFSMLCAPAHHHQTTIHLGKMNPHQHHRQHGAQPTVSPGFSSSAPRTHPTHPTHPSTHQLSPTSSRQPNTALSPWPSSRVTASASKKMTLRKNTSWAGRPPQLQRHTRSSARSGARSVQDEEHARVATHGASRAASALVTAAVRNAHPNFTTANHHQQKAFRNRPNRPNLQQQPPAPRPPSLRSLCRQHRLVDPQRPISQPSPPLLTLPLQPSSPPPTGSPYYRLPPQRLLHRHCRHPPSRLCRSASPPPVLPPCRSPCLATYGKPPFSAMSSVCPYLVTRLCCPALPPVASSLPPLPIPPALPPPTLTTPPRWWLAKPFVPVVASVSIPAPTVSIPAYRLVAPRASADQLPPLSM